MDAQRLKAWLGDVGPSFDRLRAKRRSYNREHAPDLNVFRMLGVERKEMCHSAFLASVLDPRGDHGQGDLFLRTFLERLEKGLGSSSSQASTWQVTAEEPYELGSDRGRLDIVLRSRETVVAIENKIDAKEGQDQEGQNQLNRYNKWLNSQPDDLKKVLVYLTPSGAPARSLAEHEYKRLSYQQDVLGWLELAAYESDVVADRVKQLLDLYIRVIEDLTGRERAMPADKELIELLLEPGNLQMALEIEALRPRENLEARFWKDLVEAIKMKLEADNKGWTIKRAEEREKPFIRAYPAVPVSTIPQFFFCVQHVPDGRWAYHEYRGVSWDKRPAESVLKRPKVEQLQYAVGGDYSDKDYLAYHWQRFELRNDDSASLPLIYQASRIEVLAAEVTKMMRDNRDRLVSACKAASNG